MSWLRETWNSVLGASQAPGAAGGDAGQAARPISAASKLHQEWAEGVGGYLSNLKATVEETGFAIIHHGEVSPQKGDFAKELAGVEARCRAIQSPGPKDPPASDEVWKEWASRLRQDTASRFFDAENDDMVSFRHVLARSSACETAVRCLLKRGHNADIASLLEGLMVGEPALKQQIITELGKLGEIVDGTSAEEEVVRVACAAVDSIVVDPRYDEKVGELTELMHHVRVRGVGQAAPAAGGEGGDDEGLRQAVRETAHLLDANATMRHIVDVARGMLQGRPGGAEGDALGGAKAMMAAMAEAARQNKAQSKALLEAAGRERASLSDDAARSEERLEASDSALAGRLAGLHERKRALQEELDQVMGEILGAEQQLKEVQRERGALGRAAQHKRKTLDDAMHALAVQMQDYENEEDALQEATAFVDAVSQSASAHRRGQIDALHERMREVLADRHAFLEQHAGHQLAQLGLLINCLRFCEAELEAITARAASMSRLGMSQMASEEALRKQRLQDKLSEATSRVRAIEQDVQDVKRGMPELAECVERDANESERDALRDSARRIWAIVTELEALLRKTAVAGDLGDAEAGYETVPAVGMPNVRLETDNLPLSGSSRHGYNPVLSEPPSNPPPLAPNASDPGRPAAAVVQGAAAAPGAGASFSPCSPSIPMVPQTPLTSSTPGTTTLTSSTPVTTSNTPRTSHASSPGSERAAWPDSPDNTSLSARATSPYAVSPEDLRGSGRSSAAMSPRSSSSVSGARPEIPPQPQLTELLRTSVVLDNTVDSPAGEGQQAWSEQGAPPPDAGEEQAGLERQSSMHSTMSDESLDPERAYSERQEAFEEAGAVSRGPHDPSSGASSHQAPEREAAEVRSGAWGVEGASAPERGVGAVPVQGDGEQSGATGGAGAGGGPAEGGAKRKGRGKKKR